MVIAGSKPPPPHQIEAQAAGLVQPRKIVPVKAWALVGALILTFQAYVMVKWLTGPYTQSVDPGPDTPPMAMKIAIVSYLIIQWIMFVVIGYRVLVRPWRRERRVTFDGLLFFAWCAFFWFFDPVSNAAGLFFTYNSWIPNIGSWTLDTPGWLTPGSPGHMIPEPLIFGAGCYVVAFIPSTIFGSWLMRRTRQRWPGMGSFGLIGVCYAAMVTLGLFVEAAWMRMGIYTFAGAIKGLTLFPDHYYALPVYESVLWGATLTGVAYMRWSMNDRGHSIAERGIDRVKTTPRRKDLLRGLAIIGMLDVIAILTYTIPILGFAAHSGPWPEDVLKRSYFTDHVCGPETNIACPGKNIPIFTRNSVTITPDGRIHVPDGVKAPNQPTTFGK